VAAVKATHQPPTPPVTPACLRVTAPASADPALTPSLLLRCAARYIQTYGRTTGEFFDLLSDQPFPPACASGAINIAAHGKAILCSDDGADDAVTDAAITAMRVFAAYLDSDYASGDLTVSAIDIIGGFNDDPATTDTDVVQALNEAADDWDRTHPGGGAR
jgi:hypothetical protein